MLLSLPVILVGKGEVGVLCDGGRQEGEASGSHNSRNELAFMKELRKAS